MNNIQSSYIKLFNKNESEHSKTTEKLVNQVYMCPLSFLDTTKRKAVHIA